MSASVDTAQAVAILGTAGLVAGIGTLLASEEKLTPRIIIGRAISSAALGIAAASVLAWLPNVPFMAQIGIACAVASLGTSGLERLFQRLLQR
jgi:hypothetical protein